MTPSITFYTPTFRRPRALARCLASVGAQTAVAEIEQIVVPDHVGVGVGGTFARVADYAAAVHGRYVHFLADDDVLAAPDAVERLLRFCAEAGDPPVVIVRARKGGATWPSGPHWPPVCGAIDLACLVTRGDVWRAHADDYGRRYEGDFDFADALHRAGHAAAFCDLLLVEGAVSRGAAEEAA